VIALAVNQPIYKILTVDDKPINRQLLMKLLSPLGFEIKEASDGQEAMKY
jgi:CheY-like chemotaxis protein